MSEKQKTTYQVSESICILVCIFFHTVGRRCLDLGVEVYFLNVDM